MLSWLRQLPITVKVPLVVVAVTVAVSAVISERVLSRLGQLQRDHLSALAEAYLDGLSSSILPALLRDDVWEVFDALDRSRTLYASLRPVDTVVTKPNSEVVAASNPDQVPVLSTLPANLLMQFRPEVVVFSPDGTRSFLQRDLRFQDRSVGTIYAVLDIAHLVAERRSILLTLIATNSALALVFAALGYLAVNRMVHPLGVLADHLEGGLRGHPQPISKRQFPSRGSPFARLFASYNGLVAAEREREGLSARLADEERDASLGRLASGMAHEINNPARRALQRH
jgi:signal transduction histidine kinase